MENTNYKVTITDTNEKKIFKSISKAKQFIQKWCFDNDHHTGKMDIDKRTILWLVGTFNQPIIQFEKVNYFEKKS